MWSVTRLNGLYLTMTRFSLAALTALTALLTAAPAWAAVAPRQERPLRNIDVRKADGGPVSPGERRARSALERSLGDEGIVSTDRVTGAARYVGRTDGFLNGRRSAPADAVALEYVRERPEVFGVDANDLAGLRLTSRFRSDGVTHLAYVQTDRGVAAYDNVLLANVDEAGRLLNVSGSAVSGLGVPSVTPDLDAEAALAVARREVGGSLVPPRASEGRGAERPTRFAGGDTARLTLFNDGSTTRLAWRVEVTGEHDYVYELVADATSGAVLKRRSLTEFVSNAKVYRNFPGAGTAFGGDPVTVDLAADPTWLNASAGNTRLSGNNAHAYIDADATDGITLPPTAPDAEVPASAGTDWIYDRVGLSGCPPAGCSWNPAVPSSRATNRNQATTQLFYLVNTYHDHLEDPSIGFTPTARNFEATGGDAVQAETDNFSNPDGTSPTSVNNASMTTRPDGIPPRLQMDLFTNPGLNAAETADVVYHEYTHGLTNRTVGSGVGLDANQSRAMGEGWSDWYALDFLALQGLRVDTAARGEMTIGGYLQPGGFRTQGADCPVATNAPLCPGVGPGNTGGYTLGDVGSISGVGFEVHADGEIWLETLWDLRQALPTPNVAESLITNGLRLAPNNPSFLEARDAILLADQTFAGGANYETIWTVFARRGMGFSATTTSSASTSAQEAFDLPPRLVHVVTATSDVSGGDGDDVPEPGETITLNERLRNPHATMTDGIQGTLGTSAPGFTVGQPGGTWLPIGAGQNGVNSPAFEFTLPGPASPNANCDTTVQLNLTMTTNQGGPFTIPLRVPIGSRSTDDPPTNITPTTPLTTGVTSTVTFNGSGPVNDLEVRITKLRHTWVGDLTLRLTNPAGTKTVTLMNRPGAAPNGSSGDDFTDLVFDDDAATPIASLPATNPPGGYTGRFRPDGLLSVFNGDDRLGAWKLTVIDNFPTEDSGTLFDWGIRPSGGNPAVDPGCPNRAPEAAADAFSVPGGQTLTAPSVLANDSDPDGNPITAVKDTDPVRGTVAVAANGTFTYTPQSAFRGTDSFTYHATDGTASSPSVTVTISVGNTPPAAVADSYGVAAGSTLSGASVLANDSDPNGDTLSASLVSGPAHGTLVLAPNGTFTYTPDDAFTGRDGFAYVASDGTDSSPAVTATIDVAAGAAAPQPPAPTTPPPPLPPPPVAPPAPAKLQVLRAGVSGGSLDVLAAITAKATGKVKVSYRSAGVTSAFDAAISGGQIRFRKALPRSQRSKPTGIFTLTYAGTAAVEPDSVTLRAARGKARLVRTTSRIDTKGRLLVAGTITPRARGVVRVRLGYAASGGASTFLDYRAKITAGRWSLTHQLPPAAAKAGGQLSIQFTGLEPSRIRGEQIAKEVAGGG